MHKALTRQLRRCLGVEDETQLEAVLQRFETGTPGGSAAPLPGLRDLLGRIDSTYEQFERDLELRTRSLALSSEEQLASNNRLKDELAARERAIGKLQETAATLQLSLGWAVPPRTDGNLENLIELVTRMVAYREQSQRELHDAQQALENQKFALDQHAIVSITDTNGNIIYANDRFCEISGYSREELLGQSHRIANSGIHPAEYFRDMWQTITSGEVWTGELCNRSKDGSLYWVAATIVPFLDEGGRPYQYAGIRTDITERKHAEIELLKAKEAAESANRAKSDFLANMSHEIRTPMNGIIGMTELALDTDLNEEQQEFLRIVKSSAQSLLTIINDILDFSKIEAGKLLMEEADFELEEVIGDALKTLALRAHEKRLELICQIDPTLPTRVVGDSVRLRQVLVNLVGNAIKFTEAGEIVVDVTPDVSAGSAPSISFEVRDTGIGIPADKISQIFAPFTQEDSSTTRRFGGTGLGLTISSRLVAMMGGTIRVDSTPGQGSSFRFSARLPASSSQAASTRLAMEHLAGLSMLVVDDNDVNRRVLSETLAQWRIRVREVAAGSAVLAALNASPTDLVLLDYLMPDMDGVETARAITTLPAERRPVVIMLSSAGGISEGSGPLQTLGISATLTKPVLRAELLTTLLRVLGKAAPALAQAPTSKKTAAQAMTARPMNILLVEDHPINQKLALNLLTKWGHKTLVANDGQEALDKLTQLCFDVVLMDVQMPVMDGLTATREFRRREGDLSHTPIIAMTANAMEGDREICLAAGMDDYIAKPIRQDALQALLQRFAPQSAGSFDYAAALAAADQEMVDIVVDVFLTEFPKDLALLRAAAATPDPAELQRTAHSMKSSCALFGAQPMVEIARKLEHMAPEEITAAAAALIAGLEIGYIDLERVLTARPRLG